MAAAIDFFAGSGSNEIDLAGSGLGFFGATFGSSVQVSQYQDTTFITNGVGSVNGGQADNLKYVGTTSGVSINGGATVDLTTVPQVSGTLNTRFTFDTVVKTQNGELRIYDRTTIDNGPSGVTCRASQIVNGGSGVNPTTGAAQTWNAGDDGWRVLAGSGTTMRLLAAPGSGGLSPSGVDTTDTRHDWYAALSASPDSIGSKTLFGLYVSLEYL